VPEILVILGAHNVNQIEPSQQRFTVTSANILIHPGFFPVSMANDLSMITLPSPAQLTAAVNIVQLPSQSQADDLFEGAMATAIGFGSSNPDVLRSVDNTIMSNVQCAGFYGPVIVNANVICMNIDQNASGNLCTADWGSGVVLEGTRLLIGVKSIGGNDACRIGMPAGLSRVTSFLGWIGENVVG
jgi:secreted trypsin-like serine protease